jgi:hypothetical protein
MVISRLHIDKIEKNLSIIQKFIVELKRRRIFIKPVT